MHELLFLLFKADPFSALRFHFKHHLLAGGMAQVVEMHEALRLNYSTTQKKKKTDVIKYLA
jgi:hypothetical protein